MSLDDISVESVLAQARTLPRTQQLCLTCAKAEWRQVTKRNAEFGKDLEGLQADVLARARTERLKTLGGSASTGDQNGSAAFQAAAKSAGLKDLSEAVDDLRSEVTSPAAMACTKRYTLTRHTAQVARARFELRSTLQNKTSNP